MEGVRNYTRIEIVLRSNSWPQHVTDLRKCPPYNLTTSSHTARHSVGVPRLAKLQLTRW